MTLQLSSELVWNELKKELFAVLGTVSVKGEARTAGIVYAVIDHCFYIVTGESTWKVRNIRSNPNVSITVPIAKRIPVMPWIKIPSATITVNGKGIVLEPKDVDPNIIHTLLRGNEANEELLADMVVIKVEPQGDFITYGVGVSLMTMRHPEQSRGRAPVR